MVANSNGTEYNFEMIKSSNNPDMYIIQDVNGNVVGAFNLRTGEFYKGISQLNPVQFAKSNDGRYIDTSKLDVQDLNYDLEKGTLSIIDKDGTSVEFNIENINNSSLYNITDMNGNTVGKFTPSDVESILDLTDSGGKTFKVETLSEENKDIFNAIFENNKELANYLKNGDYDGLKEALNKELEDMLGKTNPELLEKAQKVVNDMNLDGVKTKEDFLDALNKSLDDNGFDSVEYIKNFPSIEDILNNPTAIAACSATSVILMALLKMLIQQILQKNENEEEDEKQDNDDEYFDVNAKNHSTKKNSKHTISSPDELLNVKSNNKEIKK